MKNIQTKGKGSDKNQGALQFQDAGAASANFRQVEFSGNLNWSPATVLGVDESDSLNIHLVLNGEHRAARLAASCWLQPKPGDLVLALLGSGEARDAVAWVHSVLRRAEMGGEATLAIPGAESAVVQAPKLVFHASNEISVETGFLRLRADDMELSSRTVRFFAEALHGAAGALSFVSDRLQVMAKKLSISASVRVVTVDEADTLRTGHRSVKVDGLDVLEAGQMIFHAKDAVRVSSKSVLLG